MKESIELHDSQVFAVSCIGDSVELTLRPAYIHRSTGLPGDDASSVWLQSAFIVISAASISSAIQFPVIISDGSLRIDSDLHENCIPAAGTFGGVIEVQLILVTCGVLTILGDRISIVLCGEPTYLEEFAP